MSLHSDNVDSNTLKRQQEMALLDKSINCFGGKNFSNKP